MAFDRLGVFTYSPEEDTPAASMADQIAEEVKEERQAELMELQQDVSLELGEERVGQKLFVFIEGKWRMRMRMWAGHMPTHRGSTDTYSSIHRRR